MDNNSVEMVVAAAQNKKKAAIAMCKTVLLLMTVNVLSKFFSFSFGVMTELFSVKILRIFVGFFSLFGVSTEEAYNVAGHVLGSESFAELLGMATLFLGFVVPVMIFAKLEGVEKNESFCVDGNFVKPLVPMFCLCHLFSTLASVFAGVVNDFMLPDSSAIYEALTGIAPQEFNLWEFIISVLTVAVFVPLVEEYVYRGVLFSYLSKYGTYFGIVASSVAFGIAHSSPVQSVYAFVFGILSATLVAVTGNIKTSVLFHALNNFSIVAFSYIMGNVGSAQFDLINCFYIMIVSALGVYGIYAFCKDGGIMTELSKIADKNDGACAGKCGMKQIIVLPLLAYLAYYAFSVFRTVM